MSYTTAVINVRTESQIKEQAREVAAELGLSLSAVINAFLRQLVRTRTILFSAAEEPNEYLLDLLKQSKEDIEKKFVSPFFTNADEAMSWLNNPGRKYENQI